MHIITIACAPTVFQFVYKTKDAAEEVLSAYNTESTGNFEIQDDFGQFAIFKLANISVFVVEDCDLSKRAHIDRSLHQQRMQFEAQKAAESDPAIRAAMRGPAMIAPMGNFNGRMS
jgi:hypothetical protein